MKEQYFTPSNIKQKASFFLDELKELVRIRDIPFVPNKSALIVLDMQEFFLDSSSHAFIPSACSIIPNIANLVEAFDNKGLLVVFTQHSENKGLMKSWWRGSIPENDILSPLAKNARIIKKTQYDAFYNTDLESFLRKNGVEQVVISGVMTHLCCETTARSAFVRGFQPFFLIDGTATYNEAFHKSSLLNLAHGFAVPVLTEQILEAMR